MRVYQDDSATQTIDLIQPVVSIRQIIKEGQKFDDEKNTHKEQDRQHIVTSAPQVNETSQDAQYRI